MTKILYQIYHTAGISSTLQSDSLARKLMGVDKDFIPFAVGTRGKKKPECDKP